jgi:hypothetical protein
VCPEPAFEGYELDLQQILNQIKALTIKQLGTNTLSLFQPKELKY